MERTHLQILNIIKLALFAILILACEKTIVDVDNNTDFENNIPMGTIEFDFQLPNGNLIDGCVIKVNLVIAIDADNLYRENYIKSFNVSDRQQIYSIKLPPGSYHFQAGVMCICETTGCSAGGYPGGQFGLKYTADEFYITADETTFVVPIFH